MSPEQIERSNAIGRIQFNGKKIRRDKWPVYNAWRAIRQRCNNPKDKGYYLYGARGIKVCKEWECFETFYRDMGERPDGMSIDRINNNEGYSPSNCRWATPTQQCENTRVTRLLALDGQIKTLRAWGRHFGIATQTITHRIDVKGWAIRKALTTPTKKYRKRDPISGELK